MLHIVLRRHILAVSEKCVRTQKVALFGSGRMGWIDGS
jgi:hypothetical protein